MLPLWPAKRAAGPLAPSVVLEEQLTGAGRAAMDAGPGVALRPHREVTAAASAAAAKAAAGAKGARICI